MRCVYIKNIYYVHPYYNNGWNVNPFTMDIAHELANVVYYLLIANIELFDVHGDLLIITTSI